MVNHTHSFPSERAWKTVRRVNPDIGGYSNEGLYVVLQLMANGQGIGLAREPAP